MEIEKEREIVKMYQELHSHLYIAVHLHEKENEVKNVLIKHGIPMRKKGGHGAKPLYNTSYKNKYDHLFEDVNEGKSYKEYLHA